MSARTSIEWTDRTWNPVRGCSRVSAGCDRCYAMRQARRMDHPGGAYEGLTRIKKNGVDWSGKVRMAPSKVLAEPLRWKKPARVFVNSMSDLFHPSISFASIAEVFGVMAAARQHTFQVLTKRPEVALRFFRWVSGIQEDPSVAMQRAAWNAGVSDLPLHPVKGTLRVWPWPLTNVWIGVSVEDQKAADERVPLLLEIPASVRFLSCEPLLGPISFDEEPMPDSMMGPWSTLSLGIDWVIVGGESGAGARPMHPDWARSLRDECQEAGVPFLFKQWGDWAPIVYTDQDHNPVLKITCDGKRERVVGRNGLSESPVNMRRVGKKLAGREIDGRTWDEFPEVSPA